MNGWNLQKITHDYVPAVNLQGCMSLATILVKGPQENNVTIYCNILCSHEMCLEIVKMRNMVFELIPVLIYCSLCVNLVRTSPDFLLMRILCQCAWIDDGVSTIEFMVFPTKSVEILGNSHMR